MKRGLFQNLQQQSTLLAINFVLLAAILTDSLTVAQQVYVQPNTALLNEGERTDLLCNYGRKIDYCRIEIPGEPKVLNLSPRYNKNQGFTYFGTSLDAGQCGVSIERVKAINNGQVKCTLGAEGEEYEGRIDLVVTMRPSQPSIQLDTKPDANGYFKEGDNFQARCIIRDGRPAANITWFLDGVLADKRTSQMEIVESPHGPNSTLLTSVQAIQWQLGPEDNNRKLICRSHHQTDRDSLPPQEAAVQLSVRFRPVSQPEALVYGLFLERTAMVNITIQSNPPPTVEWNIDGVVIPQGSQDGRFSAFEPEYLGHDYYNVSLGIAGLTLEDTTKTYQLRASNALGSTDYQVRISSSSTPPTAGLDIGAIVGIIVAIAVLVLVILLIVFARATGRWCFGGKSVKSATNETITFNDPEAQQQPRQQHGQNVALLEMPNGVTIIPKPANSQDRHSVQRRRNTDDDEDDSFEYATDRESSGVYNPTTVPLRTTMATAGGRNSYKVAIGGEPAEHTDLLERGNQLGIPESRFSRWLPKDQREILEKQAKLLAHRFQSKTPETPRAKKISEENVAATATSTPQMSVNGNSNTNTNANSIANPTPNTKENTSPNSNNNSTHRPLPTETEI